MSGHVATASEWAEMTSLAVALYASVSVPFFLLVDADLADFDPRPAVFRQVESGRFDALLVAVANVKYDAREFVVDARSFARLSLRDSAFTATALLALLVPAPSESAR